MKKFFLCAMQEEIYPLKVCYNEFPQEATRKISRMNTSSTREKLEKKLE